MAKVYFNVLAKDLENAVAISRPDPSRILVGVMVKPYKTNEEVAEVIKSFMANDVLASVGLGAGDPAQWKRVADTAALCKPPHINQVFPAAGYTQGRMEELYEDGKDFLVNSLLEPAEAPGRVYVTTGAISQNKKESISCEAAAKLMADIGLKSVKFYPINGLEKKEDLKLMVEAAVKEGITCFEPTGGIGMDNVHEIVQICIDAGAETVIPHLYTSLIDPETKETKAEYLKQLVDMTW